LLIHAFSLKIIRNSVNDAGAIAVCRRRDRILGATPSDPPSCPDKYGTGESLDAGLTGVPAFDPRATGGQRRGFPVLKFLFLQSSPRAEQDRGPAFLESCCERAITDSLRPLPAQFLDLLG
jgi:hypothetical protein